MFDTEGESRIAHRDGCACEACCRAAEDADQQLNASILESAFDAAAGTSTIYSMSVGDTFFGDMDDSQGFTDRDWVAITLTAGESITIDMAGLGSAPDDVTDPILRVYSNTGAQLAFDDDSGPGLDAQIDFTATYSGTYFIGADGYDDGTYTITVTAGSGGGSGGGGGGGGNSPTEGTLDQMATYLTDGFWDRAYFSPNLGGTLTVNITGLTAEGQQLARWAFEAWEMVTGLTFVETTSSNANITFGDDQAGAFAGPDNINSSGTYTRATVNVSSTWIDLFGSGIDSYTFGTYIHEIGHALGLGHQGAYNGSANFPDDATFSNDSYQLSVMSYFSQTDNPNVDASYGDPASAMMVDIIAIQDLYGGPSASSSPTAGNTVFGKNGNTGTYMDEIFDPSSPNIGNNPIAFTIYDVGGTDLIDLSGTNNAQYLNLNDETFSNINGATGNIGIARGTIIENAITGAAGDTIVGNEAANFIQSNGGNDDVDGGAGNDTIIGGFGFDELIGGTGNDSIDGGGNADTLIGGDGNDTLIDDVGTDSLVGGDGNDRIISGSGADRVDGGDGNDFIRAGSNFGSSVDGVDGGAGNDTIFGDAGFDLILGGEGDDSIDGGAQADNLYGDAGNDTILGGDGFDRLFGGTGDDSLDGQQGTDALFGSFGNDTMHGGDDRDRFFGGSDDDLIFGDGGNDELLGGGGFDTLNGGTGDDRLLGNFNADVFVFEDGHGNDTIADFDEFNGFEKIDLSAISTLSGIGDLNLGSSSSGAAVQSGGNVIITTASGNTITLEGVNIANLDSSDFIF